MQLRVDAYEKPAPVADAMDDIAVDISRAMQAKGLGPYAFMKLLGWSEARCAQFSRYLRGLDHQCGFMMIVKAAQAVGVKVLILSGDEAAHAASSLSRSRTFLPAPPLTPSIEDLTSQVAA